ncbi:hypothetical protein [Aeromonas veronii]|uniref:hypothetical protein n=1 Tax=Aeromonas veronii TaxID=654 RepID=UPI003005FA7D
MNINPQMQSAIERFVIDCFEYGETDCEWIYAIVENASTRSLSKSLTLLTMTGLNIADVTIIAKQALQRHAVTVQRAVHMQQELDGMQGGFHE